MAETDDLIPISAIQHWLYCPRQAALIHVERLWAENVATAEGRILHERTDRGEAESRGGVRTLRSLPLRSHALGLVGLADVVEVRDGRPFPVEYKRGRPKPHRADEAQLCAQAICLEEAFGVPVPEGALFYGKTRRRKAVLFDAALRRLVAEAAAALNETIAAGRTPPAAYEPKRCGGCSLQDLCQPKALARAGGVDRWLERALATPALADPLDGIDIGLPP